MFNYIKKYIQKINMLLMGIQLRLSGVAAPARRGRMLGSHFPCEPVSSPPRQGPLRCTERQSKALRRHRPLSPGPDNALRAEHRGPLEGDEPQGAETAGSDEAARAQATGLHEWAVREPQARHGRVRGPWPCTYQAPLSLREHWGTNS